MLRRLLRAILVFFALLAVASMPARAQAPKAFTQDELDQMLAPIALFPDALLAQTLMAATYPSDVAQAVDWAFANRSLQGDAAVRAVQDKPWDPSVQSLVAFPEVLAMFGESPQWVRNLGDAFLDQPEDVMNSVQFLRAKAKSAGNLASNEQQVVTVEAAPAPATTIIVNNAPPPPAQIITIAPANPQVVFVPIYNPAWAFGPWWAPAFPPFFFPPPPRWGWGWGSAASAGFWWGVGVGVSYSLWGGMNWRTHNVNVNVNHWNNINVNRRIDSRDRNVDWRHDARNRRDVPYRSPATRDRVQSAAGDARSREAYRGRDLQRDQARAAVENRVGAENVSREALRDVDRNSLPQRPPAGSVGGNARDRAASLDRGQVQDRAGTIDRRQIPGRPPEANRPQVPDRAASIDRGQVQDRAGTIDRAQAQNRVQNAPRPQTGNRQPTQQFPSQPNRADLQNRANQVNRDNALRGASNPQQVRQQIDRGNVSRQSMQQQAASRNVNRGNVGGAAAAQNINRGNAGAAAAARRR